MRFPSSTAVSLLCGPHSMGNSTGDLGCGQPLRIISEVSIALCGAGLPVSQERANDGQRQPVIDSRRGEGVSEVMQAEPLQSSHLTDGGPRVLDVDERDL